MLVYAHPPAPGVRIKGGGKRTQRRGGWQDSMMLTATGLKVVVVVANANLVQLVQQQVEVKN